MRQCTDCDNEINPNRLRSMPSANRCTLCQEIQDGLSPVLDTARFNRLGAAGKFSVEDLESRVRYRPLVTYGLAHAVSSRY